MITLRIEPQQVRGFNFHPSYSTGSLEDWINFDLNAWEKELKNGKEKFPKMNVVRIWLSWNAYCRLENRFVEEVRAVIDICKALGLYVIPCLFNRWHDPMIDCDGIYIDHFLPNSSWLLKFGDPFGDYVEALAEEFKDEENILVWDLCNEPLAYNGDFPLKEYIKKYELEWLARMAALLRSCHVSQPLGIGSTGGESMEIFGDICDVYLTHLYYTGGPAEKFEEKILRFVAEAQKNDKPLICSECCWGSTDDKKRSELIKVTLDLFKKHGVGYVAHALQYCGCTDLHDRADGRLTEAIGNLCFINKDGSVRPYHEIYNEY